MPRQRLTQGLGAASAVAWLAAVAALALARATAGWPAAHELAASPDALERGRLWLLGTSALVVQGPPVLQIAGTAGLIWVVVHRFGAATFWATAVAGHVGGTLAVYAGIGLIWLVDAQAVRHVTDASDYGISAVWAACIGVVSVAGAAGALPRARLAASLGAGCLLAFLVLLPADGELSDVEHLVAFLAGAALAARALHHERRGDADPLRPPRLPSLRRRPRAAARAAR
ncbi:MAG TPA: hypothetical protein VK501_03235 [Baekduia sp.]|uniref:hypothetical protein n=1 Tax=Baekduia sp. TaxID=2600305 RepID=UPI002CAAAC05|nr:hypothetical protein [Baekduia sp.]HMJ32908.1 hypothetical protein [Baekduia sp.]